MYRLIASDLDETLLSTGHLLPEANIKALERLHELGVRFVPNSGRPYPSIVANFAALDQRLFEGGYVISFNGCCINRYGDPKPLMQITLDRSAGENIYRFAREQKIPLHVYTADGNILTQFLPEEDRLRMRRIAGVVPLDPDDDALAIVGDREIAKLILSGGDLAGAHALGALMEPRVDPARVELTYSSGRYLELVPAGVNKGTGLARLAELTGIDLTEMIALGDAANDIEMFRAAGLAVGVANITDDARPFCDLVLETSANDGALAEVVRTIIEPEHAR